MSSNVQPPDPAAQAPVEAAPPAPEAAPEPPRDEAGRFAALEPPVVQEQPGLPQPPALPRVNPDEAVQFYERLSHPQTRAEEFVRVGREYGFVPEGLTPDQVQEALLLYDDYQRQMGVQPGTPAAAPPLPGQPLPGPQPDGGWQQPVPFDPNQFGTQLLDQWDQRQAQREQEAQVKAEQNRRVENLQTAVGAVAQEHGLTEVQAHGLLQQVALGIDTAVQQGRPVDFSAEALQAYGEQVYGVFAGMGRAAEQAQTQEAIAHHRSIAPQTTVPTGAPAAGAPGGPRGIKGVVDRINADRAARAAGG